MSGDLNPDGTPKDNIFGSLLTGELGHVPGAGKTGRDGAPTLWNMPDIPGKLWFGNKRLVPKDSIWYDKTNPHQIGQERETVSDIYKHFQALVLNDPAAFASLQQELSRGIYGRVKVTGSFDDATQKALSNALTQYVDASKGTGTAINFTQFLDGATKRYDQLHPDEPHGPGSGGKAPAPPAPPPALQLNLQDPASIKAAAQSAAQQSLGQGLSAEQLNAFVTRFQQEQTNSQTSSYNNQLNNTAGTTTQPDLSSDAAAYAQQSSPDQYKQNQRESFVDTLVNMFAPAESQRANITPTPSIGGGPDA